MMKQVEIFTDGSCLGNPGPGGYGAVLRYKQHEKELSAGFYRTTNNRMELLAAIEGLASLKQSCQVDLPPIANMFVRVLPNGSIIGKNGAGKPQIKSLLKMPTYGSA